MKKLLSAVAFAVLLAAALPAQAETVSVRAEGMAVKTEGAVDVKRTAIDNALRFAVTAAVDMMIDRATAEANYDHIEAGVYSRARSYVVNYRIITEGWMKQPSAGADTGPPAGIDPYALPQTFRTEPQDIEIYQVLLEATVDSRELRAAIDRIIVPANGKVVAITVKIIEVTDYPEYKGILSAIKRAPNMRGLSYDSFFRGRVVLVARTSTNVQTFLEAVEREAGEAYEVMPGGPKVIIIKPSRRAPAQ